MLPHPRRGPRWHSCVPRRRRPAKFPAGSRRVEPQNQLQRLVLSLRDHAELKRGTAVNIFDSAGGDVACCGYLVRTCLVHVGERPHTQYFCHSDEARL